MVEESMSKLVKETNLVNQLQVNFIKSLGRYLGKKRSSPPRRYGHRSSYSRSSSRSPRRHRHRHEKRKHRHHRDRSRSDSPYRRRRRDSYSRSRSPRR